MARHGKKKGGRILQRMAFAAVVAVSILMSFWALGARRLGNHEAYVAIAAREMVSSGNWLLPYYNGQVRLEKTPLNYWLVAAAAKAAGGVNDCIVRLPNAILAALSVIAIFYFVSGHLGARIAVLSSLIWATSLGYVRYSHTGRPEMSLTVFVAIAMMSFYSAINTQSRRERIFYSLVFWVSFALAMLAKGPAPLLIVVPPIIIYLAVFQGWRKIKGIMPIVGLILFLLIILPWPLMVAAKMHEIRKSSVSAQQQAAAPELTKGQGKALALWKKEFVDRFMGKYASGEKPGYYYLGVMFIFFLPFSAFVPAALAAPFYPVWEKKRETMFYLWLWFTVGIVAMTLCGGKRQHYILPLMPAMAILAGIIADDMIFVNKAYSRKFAMFFWVGHLFAIFCVAAGAIICMRSELYPLQFVTVSTAVVMVAVLFNISVLFWLDKKVVAVICLFAVLCISILMWPVLGYEQEDENYIIYDFAGRAAAVLGGRDVVSYGRVEAEFIYYLGRNVPVIEDANEIYERYLNDSGVIALKDNFERLKNDERFRFRISSLDRDRGLFLKETAAPAVAKSPAVSKALEGIIARRSSWNPILANFYGREMPDFKVEDINGKTHSLKNYRGKNVLVVMWATWCLPCQEEIPHLTALREIMPADKLAILAISNEPVSTVKAMAQSRNINYTVISNQGTLPEPFSSIRGYPSAFFIRPDGTLKLVVEGGSTLGEMKAIILAE